MRNKLLSLWLVSITMLAVLASCSLVDDIFDGSEGAQSREFKSKEWSSVERNVFTVEPVQNIGDKDPMLVTFPENGTVFMVPDYDKGHISLLFKSFQVVDPAEKPADWDSNKGIISWIRSAFEIYLLVEDVPFNLSDDGRVSFSQKTMKGVLNYCHVSGDQAVNYKKLQNCKVSITGELSQESLGGRILYDVPMNGNIELKIIAPKNDRNILSFTELIPKYADKGFLEFYK